MYSLHTYPFHNRLQALKTTPLWSNLPEYRQITPARHATRERPVEKGAGGAFLRPTPKRRLAGPGEAVQLPTPASTRHTRALLTYFPYITCSYRA